MILTDVLTATDLNPMYYKFIPIFIKAWKKLFPEINIHIILIADKIIEELEPYKEYIKLFSPIEGIKSGFIAQNIRLFYPCLLESAEGGIIITDMDMIPMNTAFYRSSIKDIANNKFINLPHSGNCGQGEHVMCYNIAYQDTWRDVFEINNIDDINQRITMIKSSPAYTGHIQNRPFWIADQLYLFEQIRKWQQKTNNFIIIRDAFKNYELLDRVRFPNQLELNHKIRNKVYKDFHLLRPYPQYKNIINTIVDLL